MMNMIYLEAIAFLDQGTKFRPDTCWNPKTSYCWSIMEFKASTLQSLYTTTSARCKPHIKNQRLAA